MCRTKGTFQDEKSRYEKEDQNTEMDHWHFIGSRFSGHGVSGNSSGAGEDLSFCSGTAFPVRIYTLLLGIYVQRAILCLPDILGETVLF